MRTGLKHALYFAGGLSIGIVGTYFAVKKYFQRKADEQIEDVKRAFGNRLDELEEERNKALGIANKAIIESNGYEDGKNPGGRDALRGDGVLRGIIKNVDTKAVDYTKYYSDGNGVVKEKVIEELGESEADLDAEEADKFGDVLGDGLSEPSVTSDIEIISPEEYGGMAGYDYKELYFYVGNNCLVNEDEDEVIDDSGYLLGNMLETSGFISNGEENIYIRNNRIGCDFEVIKTYQTYDGPLEY